MSIFTWIGTSLINKLITGFLIVGVLTFSFGVLKITKKYLPEKKHEKTIIKKNKTLIKCDRKKENVTAEALKKCRENL